MSIDNIFEYRRDGVEIIRQVDKLIIRKNGLTIELPYEIVTDLAEQFAAFSDTLDKENRLMINEYFKNRREP